MNYEINKLNDQGKGICYVDDKITFVDNTVIGDIVTLNITKTYRKYNLAEVTQYIKKSPSRIKSPCPYSDTCGGCVFLNTSYETSLKFKQQKLKNVLAKFAGIKKEVSIIPSNPNLNYRNKITLKIKNGVVGYYEESSNKLVPIKSCLLASPTINSFIKYINDFEVQNGEVVIRSNYNNELLINFITEDPVILPIIKDLKIVGILKNGNILKGDNKFMQLINGHFFQVSYDSFFQINPDICSQLFALLNKYILPNSTVLDLYCGVGSLGISVANKIAHLYGIEIVPNAIINAITNAKMNGVTASYMLGDVKDIITKIPVKFDVIIIDPPRTGLEKSTLSVILKELPEELIYISCDPITLARDLKQLLLKYQITYLECLDMFPYSYHVETFCVLTKI